LQEQLSGLKILELAPLDVTIYSFLLPLIDSLIEENLDVYIWAKDTGFGNKIKEKYSNYRNVPLFRGYNIFLHLYSFLYLIKLMKRERFILINTHTPITGIIGRVSAFFSNIPIIIHTSHGFPFDINDKSIIKNFYILLEKILSKITKKYIFINIEEMEFYINKKITNREKCYYIGSVGVNIEIFDRNRINKSNYEIKRELNLPMNSFILTFVGRLTYEKGIEELIKAFLELSKIYNNIYLLIVGKSLIGDKKIFPMSKLLQILEINENIIYLGYRENIPEILKITDIFLLPSHREGVPKSLLEAMAMENAIITTNISGIRQIIKDKENGLLIEPKDVNALIEAIKTLIEDSNLREKIKRNARTTILNNYDEKLIALKQKNIILEEIKNYLQLN